MLLLAQPATAQDAPSPLTLFDTASTVYLVWDDGSVQPYAGQDRLDSVALSRDGQTLLVANGGITLENLADGASMPVPETAERRCGRADLLPDGLHVLAVCGEEPADQRPTIELFHRDTGHVRTVLASSTIGRIGVIGRPLVAPDGQTAIIPNPLGDYAVDYWRLDLATGRAARLDFPGLPEYGVHVEQQLPDGRLVVTACDYCGWLGPSGPPAPPRTDVIILGPDGSLQEVLLSVEGLIGDVTLTRDGAAVLWSTFDGMTGMDQLWRQVLATGERDVLIEERRPPPEPFSFYTTVIASVSTDLEADRHARDLHESGIAAEVLYSSAYSSLNPGYWVVYVGRFFSEAEARVHTAALRQRGIATAYTRFVAP